MKTDQQTHLPNFLLSFYFFFIGGNIFNGSQKLTNESVFLFLTFCAGQLEFFAFVCKFDFLFPLYLASKFSFLLLFVFLLLCREYLFYLRPLGEACELTSIVYYCIRSK